MPQMYQPAAGPYWLDRLAQEPGRRPERKPKPTTPVRHPASQHSASDLRIAKLEEEHRQLKAENAKLQADKVASIQRRTGMSDGMARFTAGLKLPGQK